MIEICESRPHVPLFVVNKSNDTANASVITVAYEGAKYSIPAPPATGSDNSCSGDRSMHVLTFVAQLIAGQKAAMNVPVTGAVTAVGR
jgi:hypothetical protein